MTQGKGGLSLLETTAAAWGAGGEAAPKKDWEQKRFGPMIPATSIEAREKSGEILMDAMGVPSALHRSDGAAQRESFRHFFTGTIETLGALIAEELSEKLEVDFQFTFPQATRSDISAQSRGFASLIKTGMEPKDAGRKSGNRHRLRDGP